MYPQNAMTEHLMESHAVTPKMLRENFEHFSGSNVASWEDYLEVNHDLLHSIGQEQGSVS